MSLACIPACVSARRVASAARDEQVVPGSTQRRSLIPVRCMIHSSDVSMSLDRSSLVTTRGGTKNPVAMNSVRGMDPLFYCHLFPFERLHVRASAVPVI